MTTSDPPTLAALALGATPGPWSAEGFYRAGDDEAAPPHRWRIFLRGHANPHTNSRDCDWTERDARYIAACSPDVVLSLLARVEELGRAWSSVMRPDREFKLNLELQNALYLALDRWASRDSDHLDVDERAKLEALLDECRPQFSRLFEEAQEAQEARIGELEQGLREAVLYIPRLQRLYNAMCRAMASWEPPNPGDAEYERESEEQRAVRAEMHAVFNECPGVLYVDRIDNNPLDRLRQLAGRAAEAQGR